MNGGKKINNIQKRLTFLHKKHRDVTYELKKMGFNILHSEKIGLNVCAIFENDKEKEKHDSDSVRSENSDKENESKVKSLASLLRNFLNKTQKDQKDQ
jgi:hypothetical protein